MNSLGQQQRAEHGRDGSDRETEEAADDGDAEEDESEDEAPLAERVVREAGLTRLRARHLAEDDADDRTDHGEADEGRQRGDEGDDAQGLARILLTRARRSGRLRVLMGLLKVWLTSRLDRFQEG